MAVYMLPALSQSVGEETLTAAKGGGSRRIGRRTTDVTSVWTAASKRVLAVEPAKAVTSCGSTVESVEEVTIYDCARRVWRARRRTQNGCNDTAKATHTYPKILSFS